MRITSWNCLCGDVSCRLSDLAPLRTDLITLQECRRPASDSASVIWRGDIPYCMPQPWIVQRPARNGC